jgi:hypothetical protein
MKNNCIVLVSMPIIHYAPGLTQLEALKNKENQAHSFMQRKGQGRGHSLFFVPF